MIKSPIEAAGGSLKVELHAFLDFEVANLRSAYQITLCTILAPCCSPMYVSEYEC